MADIRFFHDTPTGPIQLRGIWHDGRTSGRKPEHFTGLTPEGQRVTVTRMIEYKGGSAGRHQCDDRCRHATGKVMRCECACGGLNHGKGN